MTLRLAALIPGVLVPLTAAVDYSSQIRPVLEKQCYGCHGPKTAMHGLRLDRRADAFRGGESGVPAVIAGKSAASLLYRYVAGLDKSVKMPPAGPGLSAAELKLFKTWIDEGADWPAGETAPRWTKSSSRGARIGRFNRDRLRWRAGCKEPGLGAEPDRRFRARATGEEGLASFPARYARAVVAPGVVRSDGPATNAGRTGERAAARRRYRRTAHPARLRRALGKALAGCGSVRRVKRV